MQSQNTLISDEIDAEKQLFDNKIKETTKGAENILFRGKNEQNSFSPTEKNFTDQKDHPRIQVARKVLEIVDPEPFVQKALKKLTAEEIERIKKDFKEFEIAEKKRQPIY